MNFWDSSAILPILIHEASTPRLVEIIRADREMYVWWGTEVECISAISRLERERPGSEAIAPALERLRLMREGWNEIAPGRILRESAKRLLRVHPIRAADALQLAAAIALAEQHRDSIRFLSLVARLRDAATREGFLTLPEG